MKLVAKREEKDIIRLLFTVLILRRQLAQRERGSYLGINLLIDI